MGWKTFSLDERNTEKHSATAFALCMKVMGGLCHFNGFWIPSAHICSWAEKRFVKKHLMLTTIACILVVSGNDVEIQFLSTCIMFPSLFPQFGSTFFLLKKGVSQYFCPYNECTMSLVFGDEFLSQGLYLKSHQRCSAGIRTCLSADQSSSSTLTESSFLFDSCLIHRDTVMLE